MSRRFLIIYAASMLVWFPLEVAKSQDENIILPKDNDSSTSTPRIAWQCAATDSSVKTTLYDSSGRIIMDDKVRPVNRVASGCTNNEYLFKYVDPPLPAQPIQGLPSGQSYSLILRINPSQANSRVLKKDFTIPNKYYNDFDKNDAQWNVVGGDWRHENSVYIGSSKPNDPRAFFLIKGNSTSNEDLSFLSGLIRYESTLKIECNTSECFGGIAFGWAEWASGNGMNYYRWFEAVIDGSNHLTVRKITEAPGKPPFVVEYVSGKDVTDLVRYKDKYKITLEYDGRETAGMGMKIYIEDQVQFCMQNDTNHHLFGPYGFVFKTSSEPDRIYVDKVLISSSVYINGAGLCLFEGR